MNMFISPTDALSILEHYKYFLIFPIAVIEGPIIIILSGFLVYLGYLNIYVASIVLVVADMLGDSIYYSIGRYWHKLTWGKKIVGFLGYSGRSEDFLVKHFEKHTKKTLLIAKISHGVGAAVQIASGIAGVNFRTFIWLSFIGTIFKTSVLLIVGFYVGNSYIKIDSYFDSIAKFTLSVLLILILIHILMRNFAQYFLNEQEK